MPQIPFACLSLECERLNDLCMAELPFEIFEPFLLKMADWQFGQTYLYF